MHENDEDHRADYWNASHLCPDGIHHETQDSAGNTQGKKPDVGKDIPKKSGYDVIHFPDTAEDVYQEVLLGIIEQEDQGQPSIHGVLQVRLNRLKCPHPTAMHPEHPKQKEQESAERFGPIP